MSGVRPIAARTSDLYVMERPVKHIEKSGL